MEWKEENQVSQAPTKFFCQCFNWSGSSAIAEAEAADTKAKEAEQERERREKNRQEQLVKEAPLVEVFHQLGLCDELGSQKKIFCVSLLLQLSQRRNTIRTLSCQQDIHLDHQFHLLDHQFHLLDHQFHLLDHQFYLLDPQFYLLDPSYISTSVPSRPVVVVSFQPSPTSSPSYPVSSQPPPTLEKKIYLNKHPILSLDRR